MGLNNRSTGELFRVLTKEDKKEVLPILLDKVIDIDFNLTDLIDNICLYLTRKKEDEIKEVIINKINNRIAI